ncbi:MAG: PDGLE domain-containing protein [Desulfotomaculum sp.]|nr:PDGLE domain-containing protein [Desulfotomaculum sp.]
MLKSRKFITAILLIFFIAGFLSNFASTHPDGLERAAEDLGFISRASDHVSVFNDYYIPGIKHPALAGGLAGLFGCILVFVTVTFLSKVVRLTK